jgi:uncharacterized protein
MQTSELQTVSERIGTLAWDDLHAGLDERGFATTPAVLDAEECERLAALWDGAEFRSRIHMARHGFGEGEYRYFANPLPRSVDELRRAFYPQLATAANRWAERLGQDERYPEELDGLVERCHALGQVRPTPLILRYEAGGYNALHQDLYGELAFPFQAVTVLSHRELDYEGGELVLVEQRPRRQSRAHVIALERGEFLIFTTRERPVAGSRGYYRAAMRHGVSTVTAGVRLSLGLIFHEAR